MDLRLKGKKDGIDAASEIQQQVDISIVYLTAYSDRRTVERGQKDRARWLHFETVS